MLCVIDRNFYAFETSFNEKEVQDSELLYIKINEFLELNSKISSKEFDEELGVAIQEYLILDKGIITVCK